MPDLILIIHTLSVFIHLLAHLIVNTENLCRFEVRHYVPCLVPVGVNNLHTCSQFNSTDQLQKKLIQTLVKLNTLVYCTNDNHTSNHVYWSHSHMYLSASIPFQDEERLMLYTSFSLYSPVLQEGMHESYVSALTWVNVNSSHIWQKKDFEKHSRFSFVCTILHWCKEQEKNLSSQRNELVKQSLKLFSWATVVPTPQPRTEERLFLCSSGLCCCHKSARATVQRFSLLHVKAITF